MSANSKDSVKSGIPVFSRIKRFNEVLKSIKRLSNNNVKQYKNNKNVREND